MFPVIEVLILPTGETKIETRGFAGPACRQATKDLEAAIGLKQSERLTAEYHQPVVDEAGIVQQADSRH